MGSLLAITKACIPHRTKQWAKRLAGCPDMQARLANLKRAGFSCIGAVDVGAYHGEWTRSVRSVWDVPVLMVEPQAGCKSALEAVKSDAADAPTYLEFAALGSSSGWAQLLMEETNSRIARPGEGIAEDAIQVEVRTLDEFVVRYGTQFNLLKADVQGSELEVLEGARDSLHQFEVVVLEVSVIPIGGVPTFLEIAKYMDEHGYRLYDFLPMYYRPLDNALWQGDAFFVRNDSALISSLEWG